MIEHEVAPHFGAYKENVPPTHGLGFSEFFANFLFFFLSNFFDESPPPLPSPFQNHIIWLHLSTVMAGIYNKMLTLCTLY